MTSLSNLHEKHKKPILDNDGSHYVTSTISVVAPCSNSAQNVYTWKVGLSSMSSIKNWCAPTITEWAQNSQTKPSSQPKYIVHIFFVHKFSLFVSNHVSIILTSTPVITSSNCLPTFIVVSLQIPQFPMNQIGSFRDRIHMFILPFQKIHRHLCQTVRPVLLEPRS